MNAPFSIPPRLHAAMDQTDAEVGEVVRLHRDAIARHGRDKAIGALVLDVGAMLFADVAQWAVVAINKLAQGRGVE